MAAGASNLQHALAGKCEDPNCEIHYPLNIEDENSRLTACAWFIAGGESMVDQMVEKINEVFGDRDTRIDFLRFNYDHDADDVLDAKDHYDLEDR